MPKWWVEYNIAQKLWTILLALYFFVLPLLLAYVLVAAWPDTKSSEDTAAWESSLSVFAYTTDNFPAEARLFLIVILAGALGSFVHACTSFASYVGNRSLKSSWALWYVLRPVMGIGIALIFYFLVRGGLLLLANGAHNSSEVNPFGIAAIASLAGMFSKQAIDKLREVFDSLFKSDGDKQREDKLRDQRFATAEMIKRGDIQCVRLAEDQTEADVKIGQLHAQLGPRVTRLPVFNRDWSLNCVIHQSLVYKFITDESVAAAKDGNPVALDDLCLADFLKAPGMRAMTLEAVAFVGPNATVSEARSAMLAVDGCQDVFVTATGNRADAVLGWITNGMIARLSDA